MKLGDKVIIKPFVTPEMLQKLHIDKSLLSNPLEVTDVSDPFYTEIGGIRYVPNRWLQIVKD
jgi:hypothetical protein